VKNKINKIKCSFPNNEKEREKRNGVKCIEKALKSDRKMVIKSGINFHRRASQPKDIFFLSMSNYHNVAHDYSKKEI
jgi:hypothetical protein